MKTFRTRLFGALVCACFFSLLAVPAAAAKKDVKTPDKPAAPAGPPFTLTQPAGWNLHQSGECDLLTLYLQNSAEPLQQFFFFPRFGPVYMTQEQKAADLQYETLSGRNLARRDMPVIDPLSPENFIRFAPEILQMKTMRTFMPQRPGIRNVEVVTVTPQKKALDYPEAATAIIRILFVQDNRLGEGLIALTTSPSPEFRGNPGGGIGMGYLLYGVTAPKGELSARLPDLLATGRSFKLSPDYETACKKSRAEDMPVLLNDGQSLKPVMDMLAMAWEKRSPQDDMRAEKKADSLRGVERLYRPATGDVYEFPAGFSTDYLARPHAYTISDLKPLPDDPALWRLTPQSGIRSVIKK